MTPQQRRWLAQKRREHRNLVQLYPFHAKTWDAEKWIEIVDELIGRKEEITK